MIGQFSKAIPDVALDRFESGKLDEFATCWALGSGSSDVLISGLKSKEKFCRWAAAESLIRRNSLRATSALLEALKDRSSDVKFAVVSTMQKRKRLRRPEAIPALKRIVASKAVQKNSPVCTKLLKLSLSRSNVRIDCDCYRATRI